MPCMFCVVEMPHLPTESCEDNEQQVSESIKEATKAAVANEDSQGPGDVLESPVRGRGRPIKDHSTLLDPISTGRKQAAVRAVILPGEICEWAGLKYAGGGAFPIIGCIGRPASDRHHGPDKSTLNNSRPEDMDEYNLHKICDWCHNTWHAMNDSFYDVPRPADNSLWVPNVEFKLHDPHTKATKEEILSAEIKRFK